MKRILPIVCLLFVWTGSFSQEKKSTISGNLERIYPWYGFTLTAGFGVLPYGTHSINNKSQGYYHTASPNLSKFLGISYTFKNIPLGLFTNFNLDQFYKGTDWIPFDWVSLEIHNQNPNATGYSLHSFETSSNGVNMGVLFGDEVVKGLEIYCKLGAGTSWHEYQVTYTELFSSDIKGGTYKRSTTNYQFGIDFRYFPIPILGFSSSFAIANNFPVFTLSSAWKFGYKARKVNGN